MSTTAELIASAADLWGSDGHVDDPLDALVRASNLLGADRAVSNFGGGNTSAKGTAVDHTGNARSVGAPDFYRLAVERLFSRDREQARCATNCPCT